MNRPRLLHVLDRYLLPDELRELCDDHEASTEGGKSDLVDRIMAIEDLDPAEVVEYLDHRELIEVSGEFGLPTDGTRDELFDRVLARISEN
ncbi:MAG TPA: hypothetical protein VFF67_01920 [Thermoplasmata archaeon]|nr:hypothetical protein [Thermoplasmata archaeon]